MKNKTIIIISVILIMIMICLISVIILLNKIKEEYNSDNYEIEFEKKDIYEVTEGLNILNNRNKYFAIQDILNSLTEKIFVINEEYSLYPFTKEEAIDAIENVMDEQYVKEMNYRKLDIQNLLKKYDSYDLLIDKIYVYDLKANMDVFLIKAYLGEKEFNIAMKMDSKNQTYSLFLEDFVKKNNYNENMNIKNINISDKEITKNEYNTFEFKNINNETMAKHYLYDYGAKVQYNINLAYACLDEEYKNIRFPTIGKYKEYINQSDKRYEYLQLKKYSVENKDDYTAYTCIDQYGNKYVFKDSNVMDYKVELDNYTLENEAFNNKYKKSNKRDKGVLNIDKFFQMLNIQDYSSAYEVLSENFKQNNFKTQAEFESFIKQNLFKYNKVEFKQYINTISDIHEFNLIITDATEESSKSYMMKITLRLLDNTNYELGFSQWNELEDAENFQPDFKIE